MNEKISSRFLIFFYIFTDGRARTVGVIKTRDALKRNCLVFRLFVSLRYETGGGGTCTPWYRD